MVITDLSKQQDLNADRKAIQKNNFTGNLDHAGNKKIYKKNIYSFFVTRNCKSVYFIIYFPLI